MCSLAKQHAVFKWKDAISGFSISQGSAEALDRWGGKTKQHLISYFLSNMSAKNCRNRIVYVKIVYRLQHGLECTMRVYNEHNTRQTVL